MALTGFGPVYYLNTQNTNKFEEECRSLGIEAIAISPIDLDCISDYLMTYPRGYYRTELSKKEVAMTVSHLEIIRYGLEHSSDDSITICEDTLSFDTISKWPFSWSEIMENVPHTYDALQCCITFTATTTPVLSLHPYYGERSVSCYRITRGYAEKLMRLYRTNGKYQLEKVYPHATAEEVIYHSGITFTFPLFAKKYEPNLDSQYEHSPEYHSSSLIHSFWTNIYNVSDPALLFRF